MGRACLILQARIARGDNTGDGRPWMIDSADFARVVEGRARDTRKKPQFLIFTYL